MKHASLYDPFSGKENIDIKEKLMFLISPAYCNMLRKMAVGLTGNHKLTVQILPPGHPEMGMTDGSKIMINTLHQNFVNESIERITEYSLALVVHESLHPLFTNFQCVQDAGKKRPNENDNVAYIRASVFNILEDSRIERIGAYKFPGVAYAIESLNNFLYEIPRDNTNKKEIEILLGQLLDFVSVGKNRETLEGDLGKLWKKIEPIALMAKYSDTCNGCYFYTKKIMHLIKHLIPEQDSVEQPSMKPQNNQGNEQDVDAGTGQEPPIPNYGKKKKKGGKSKQGVQQNSQPGQGEPSKGQSSQGQPSQRQPFDGMAAAQGTPQDGSGNAQGGTGAGNGAEQLEEMLTNALNSSYGEHLKDQADNKADAAAAAMLGNDTTSEYRITTNYGTYQDLNDYNKVKESVMPVANNLRTGLKNIINYNVDEMSRYLHTGRIDAKSLSRIPSGAICAKRIEKSDESELNITVLVDLSGSMSGWNLDNSIKSCVVLQEVCSALKIPYSVIGFTGSGNNTVITHFSNRMLKGKYAYTGIVRMHASGGTPLSEALHYMPKHLSRQKEEDKLLLVITDGVPNGGPEASAEAVKRLSSYAKVYGFAIGSGRDVLESIFGTKYIGIDSLEKMPRALCRVIEKNLFRR